MSNVKFVEFREQKYPVKLGYAALKKFQADVGENVEKALSSGKMDVYEPLLYYALEMGHRYTDQEFKFKDSKKPIKKEDMELMLDDCLFEFVELIPGFFPTLQNNPNPKKKK